MILSEIPSGALCDCALWCLIDPYPREDKFLVTWFSSVKAVFHTSFLTPLKLRLGPVFVRIYSPFLRIHIAQGCSEGPDKLFHEYPIPLCMLWSGHLLCIRIFKHSIYVWCLSPWFWPVSRQFLCWKRGSSVEGFCWVSLGSWSPFTGLWVPSFSVQKSQEEKSEKERKKFPLSPDEKLHTLPNIL